MKNTVLKPTFVAQGATSGSRSMITESSIMINIKNGTDLFIKVQYKIAQWNTANVFQA